MVSTALSAERAWEVLDLVPDPEIPVVSVRELGIVRDVSADAAGVTVVLTPTYAGCPATGVIERDIRTALMEAGATDVRVETRLAPAWTTDWITPEARRKLAAHGIAPPGEAVDGDVAIVRVKPYAPPCPRCGERRTTRLSEFGATACKALYRCEACREPFEYFKPL